MPLQYTKIKPRAIDIENLDSMWDFNVVFIRKICIISTPVLCTPLTKRQT